MTFRTAVVSIIESLSYRKICAISQLLFIFLLFRYVWKVSEWSRCSSLCNGGKQTRTIECRGFLVDIQVNSSLCSAVRPETEQVCNDEPCPAEWIVGNWSQVR